MANVYEGEADARQSDNPAPAPTLFRKRYKALSEAELALHDQIKDAADVLARLIASIDRRPAVGRDYDPNRSAAELYLDNLAESCVANTTLALRHLEDAVYRAVKALTT